MPVGAFGCSWGGALRGSRDGEDSLRPVVSFFGLLYGFPVLFVAGGENS